MAAPGRIEYVGLEHRVVLNAAQGNAVIGQYVSVVLQVLTHLGGLRILQKGSKRFEHGVAIQLIRRARIIMREGHVGRCAGFDSKRHTDHFGDHVVEARRLGVKSKQLGGFEFGEPVVENCLLQHCGDLDRGGGRFKLGGLLCTIGNGRILCRRPRGGCPVPLE